MTLTECMNHDKYCIGRTDMKICGMCKSKAVNDHINSLPIDQQVELKQLLPMVSNLTCKATNGSYYTSKAK